MEIKLTKGKHAIIDDEDWELVSKYKWCYSGCGYAIGWNKKIIYMHKLINKTPEGLFTDHINQDKLDNRRINLRTVEKSVNQLNGKVRIDNKTGHRGIHWNKQKQRWQAYFNFKHKRFYLGFYKNIEEAIFARNEISKLFR